MKPDHALISLAKSGDQSAWCDLLQRHEGAMKRLVASPEPGGGAGKFVGPLEVRHG